MGFISNFELRTPEMCCGELQMPFLFNSPFVLVNVRFSNYKEYECLFYYLFKVATLFAVSNGYCNAVKECYRSEDGMFYCMF